MTLNGVMAVTLRYFTEFGKPAFQHITDSACIEPTDIVVRVRCRRKESSRSLSHLLMSFFVSIMDNTNKLEWPHRERADDIIGPI